MKNLVENFPKQLQEAQQIGEAAKLTRSNDQIQNVLICGLGGSGIGGTIVSELVENECTSPITVTKKYGIPSFVNKHTLVIISSYSGNTEESVASMEEAFKKGAKIVCVTSGGIVLDFAKKNNLDHIILPGGMPPRSCLGYSLTQLFYVLHFNGLIGDIFKTQIKNSVSLLNSDKENILKEAHKLAEKLVNKLPVIYTLSSEGVAIRFRQQINENSKMLCWHHVIPEMNHNELVGWTESNDNLAVIIFRNDNDFERNITRLNICKEVFAKYTPNIYEIFSKGSSDLERAIYHIHLTDWVSCFIADLKHVDATEVNIINHLKGQLSKS